MKNKKILIATGMFPPQVGEPAAYAQLLANNLPKSGIEVRVENFAHVLHYPKVVRHVFYFFKVFFSSFGVQTVYALDPVSVGVPAFVAAALTGKKFYLHIFGDYAWEQGSQRAGVKDMLDAFSNEYERYPLLVRILKKTQLYIALHAKRVMVPSEYLKNIVMNWGVPAGKIAIVNQAFEAPHLDELKESLRKEFGWKENAIVSVGRLVPWKGFAAVISSLPEVLASVPDAHLYIVGDGPDKHYLETKIKELKLQKHISLIGRVSASETLRMVKAADVFVLNTSYEGVSTQLLEVMALETPIVTTHVGGTSEVIEDGATGLLFNYNDQKALAAAIVECLTNTALRATLVVNAKAKTASFSEKHTISQVAQLV